MTLFLLFIVALLVGTAFSEPMFSNKTLSMVNGNMTQSGMVMTIVTVQFESIPANMTQEQIDMLGRFSNIYIVPYESMLFIKPYMRYYTALSLTQNFWFSVINITNAAAPSILTELSSNASYSPFLKYFTAEVAVKSLNTSRGEVSICSYYIEGDQSLTPFYCIDSQTGNYHIAKMPVILVFMDVAYYLFQTCVTAGVIYYFVYKLRLIRKGKKFVFVTDSTKNPPFWQCTFAPFCKTPQLTNFRFWDALQISVLHIVMSIFTLLSQFVPITWPKYNNDNDMWSPLNERLPFFIWVLVVIIVNTILFFIKLVTECQHHRRVKVQMPNTKLSKFIRAGISLLCGAACLPILIFYVGILPTSQSDYRRYLWYSSAVLFTFMMCVHLYRKTTYIDRVIMQRFNPNNIDEDDRYFELSENLSDISPEHYNEFKIAHKKHFANYATLITFLLCLQQGAWITTQIVNTFTSMFVINRFLQSTIINCLVNSSMITTYGYIVSIFVVFYKFMIDIEAPYVKLKNMIAKERGGLSWDRILGYRTWCLTVPMQDIQTDLRMFREIYYVIPMTWTVFLRLSKVMRIERITNKVLIRMGLTLFTLCVFFMASQSFDNTFFSKVGSTNAVLAILASAVMPLIPKVMSMLDEREAGIDSAVFTLRLQNALRLLERQEENRNTIQFVFGSVPNKYAPFRYIITSTLHESATEIMDPKCDYDPVTHIPMPLKEE
jgi:hypothetical protein